MRTPFLDQKLLMFSRRRDQYLCLNDCFEYVAGSTRAHWFGSASLVRGSIVTASKTSNILGLGYDTRLKYLLELKNGKPVKSQECADSFLFQAQEHGRKFEKDACDLFFDRMKHSWNPIGSVENQITYTTKYRNTCADDSFSIGATPDQLIYDPETKQLAILEIKCPFLKYRDQACIDDYENACSLLSDKHYIQCQMQMIVLSLKKAFLFFYVPQRDGSQSFNTCTWLIHEDPAYQQFLLSNIYQAYKELNSDEQEKFKIIRNEGPHNRVITHESKINHCTFLIP
jgi:hypothetical protein